MKIKKTDTKLTDTLYVTHPSRHDEGYVYSKKMLEEVLSYGDISTGTVIYEVKIVKKFKVKVPALEAQLIEVK